MDGLEQLLLRGQQQQQQRDGTAPVLSASEAERLIEGLQCMAVEDVGSTKWQAQHDAIGQLNLQAHYNARTHSDEFVVDLLVSLDKVKVLIHDLLVIEAWHDLVLPHLEKHIAEHMDPLSSYMLLYQECTVSNMLEVTLYHSHVCEAIPEDYLLELADWAYRKLTYLNSREATKFAEPKELTAAQMMAQTPVQDLQERVAELDWAAAMSSLSIVRYLTDMLSSSSAPMALLSRLVSTNDTVMALLPLLERPPWVRRRKGKMERWETAGGMRWAVVEAADRLKLGQFEIQIWLSVNNLVVEPKARAKYAMDEYRKEKLMGLKKHLNELLFDQLPVLKDLQRVLDELGLGVGAADRESYKQAGLILEQVPVIRDSLTKGRDWKLVAIQQAKTHFAQSKGVDQARVQAISKMLDQMCEMEAPEAPAAAPGATGQPGTSPDAAGSALPGPVSVECRRKVHDSGVWEPWCQFELAVDAARPPDPVEVAGPSSSGVTGGTANSATAAVRGLRYRLQAMDPSATQPLPSNGKIIFKVPITSSSTPLLAEALLQLPDAPLKDAVAQLPPIVWVTVGLLAIDGAALQLKLKRTDKPQQRDKAAGVWYAYHPVGGALTLRQGGGELGDGGHSTGSSATAAPAAPPAATRPKITTLPDKPQPAAPRAPVAAPSPPPAAPSPAAAAAAASATPASPVPVAASVEAAPNASSAAAAGPAVAAEQQQPALALPAVEILNAEAELLLPD